MKIKKISLLLVALGLTSNLIANEIESFKKGFTIGLEAVDYQLKHEGYEPRIINLESPFLVIMDIKNTATNDILYFQHLLAKDSINSLITKDFLIIKVFDRQPDAQALKDTLESKYAMKLEVKELTNGTIETYPILFTRTFDKVISDVTRNTDIAYVKKYKTPLQVRLEKEPSPKKKAYTYFKIKNSAMTYRYKYNQDTNLTCGDPRNKCFDSKLFYENRIYKIGTRFKKGGIYRTSDGELFQKVYNRNLFIDLNDVQK